MSSSSQPLEVKIRSSQRLFPPTRPTTPTTLHLSSVDASVANFSPTGAVWFFDKSRTAEDSTAQSTPAVNVVVEHLRASLTKTLETYVPWTGTLTWSPYDPSSTEHTKRFRRIQLTWGEEGDPGVEFVSAVVEEKGLAEVVPDARERAEGGGKVWDHTETKLDGLLPGIDQLALRRLRVWPNAPCLAVQVTSFACGGVAVAVVMSHPLGDATALATFVRDWTTIGRAMASGAQILPVLTPPLFDPQLVDRAAAGDIDAAKPDLRLIATSRSLPSLRYDWWAEGEKCPWPGAFSAQIPSELDPSQIQPFGDPIPWSQWDTTAPCSLCIIHFSGREVTQMWEEASSSSSTTSTTSNNATENNHKITRHDALLSHLFHQITRSRNFSSPSTTTLHFSISLHLRPRLPTPLPSHFIGSPIIMSTLSLPLSTLLQSQSHSHSPASNPLSPTAHAIHATNATFNASTVPALLHDIAYADAPHRIWRGFLGERHSMVTSWVHCRMYEVDFGLGMLSGSCDAHGNDGNGNGNGDDGNGGWWASRPRYVEAVLVNLDGLVQVMELGGGGQGGHWSDGGVDVFLSLERDAMRRFLEDGELRRFE